MFSKSRAEAKQFETKFDDLLAGGENILTETVTVERAVLGAWEDRTAECMGTSSHDESRVTVTIKAATGAEQPAGLYRVVPLATTNYGQVFEEPADVVIEA